MEIKKVEYIVCLKDDFFMPITTTPAVMTTSVQTAVPAEAATTDSKNTTV